MKILTQKHKQHLYEIAYRHCCRNDVIDSIIEYLKENSIIDTGNCYHNKKIEEYCEHCDFPQDHQMADICNIKNET